MVAMASQITSLTIVYSTVYSGTDQSKHQNSASLAFVRGIKRWPVNSPHKCPVMQKMHSIWWHHHDFAGCKFFIKDVTHTFLLTFILISAVYLISWIRSKIHLSAAVKHIFSVSFILHGQNAYVYVVLYAACLVYTAVTQVSSARLIGVNSDDATFWVNITLFIILHALCISLTLGLG